jgi:hypothetical protein
MLLIPEDRDDDRRDFRGTQLDRGPHASIDVTR